MFSVRCWAPRIAARLIRPCLNHEAIRFPGFIRAWAHALCNKVHFPNLRCKNRFSFKSISLNIHNEDDLGLICQRQTGLNGFYDIKRVLFQLASEDTQSPQGSDYIGRLQFSVAYAFDSLTLIVKVIKVIHSWRELRVLFGSFYHFGFLKLLSIAQRWKTSFERKLNLK